ncbi:MAG: hypothetical protein HY292_12555 [Planctomycetes bacterium]|nr:hypothetical protein [Planctomycetota bacterium]
MIRFEKRAFSAIIATAFLAGSVFASTPPLPSAPFSPDPKLEPMQSTPFVVDRFTGWKDGVEVAAHYLPMPSFGDGGATFHGHMFVLIDSAGRPVAQPPLLDAIPKGAAGAGVVVPDIVARTFSPTWEITFLRLRAGYNPNNPAIRIDTLCDVMTSTYILDATTTNMYLNAPVVPAGSTVADGSRTPIAAQWQGQFVNIVPYDVNDWQAAISELYVFKDPNGLYVGSPVFPLAPGDENFNPLMRVMDVHVDGSYVADSIQSKAAVLASGFPIEYSGISINAPIVEVGGAAVPIESAFTLALNARRTWAKTNFPFEKRNVALHDDRAFKIEGVAPRPDDPGLLALVAVLCNGQTFPAPPVGPGSDLQPLIEDASGNLLHVDQALLDDVIFGPRLPLPLQQNIERFFPALAAAPIDQKLTLIGQALFERPFKKSEGVGNTLNEVSCASCHQFGGTGGAGAAGRDPFQPGHLRRNTPMLFGAGVLERIEQDRVPDGSDANPKVFRHKGLATLREICSGAAQNELGMQAPEVIVREHPGVTFNDAKTQDFDGDGIVGELTTGDITAITLFSATTPLPIEVPLVDGVNLTTPARLGDTLFFRDVGLGGAGCGSCHIEFLAADGPSIALTNPETPGSLTVPVPVSVDPLTGQIGAILYGDMKRHKLGPLAADPIPQDGVPADVFITAELWGVGSTAPYWHDSRAGNSLEAAILLHKGATIDARVRTTIGAASFNAATGITTIPVTVQNTSASPITASNAEPIHVILTKLATRNVYVIGPDGGAIGPTPTNGSFWVIPSTLGPGQTATINARFFNPRHLRLTLSFNVTDNAGYSEALDEELAFERLSRTSKDAITKFLRTLRQP